jgi:hypothetical protein
VLVVSDELPAGARIADDALTRAELALGDAALAGLS